MIQKCGALLFIGLLIFTANFQIIHAQSGANNSNGNISASAAQKIKVNVLKRGTGTKAKVNIRMLNGTKLKGYISQTGEDSFTLTDSKTNQTTTLAYADIKEVKGNGLSTGAKIAIFGGITAAVVVAVIAYSVAHALDNWKF